MKKILAALAVSAAIILGFSGPAAAHTASASASCSGVVLKAVYYDSQAVNKWAVTIGGVTQTGVFGSSYSNTFPVLQGGATTAWSASVDAPGTSYDFSFSGSVGPCGTVPPPPTVPPVPPTPPVVKHARTHVAVVDKCNCYRDKVTMTGGEHVKIKMRHPSNTLWVFSVTADEGYVLPNKIGGNSGWAAEQVYKVRTQNQTCPCKEHGNCQALYPNFTPPQNSCRPGRDC